MKYVAAYLLAHLGVAGVEEGSHPPRPSIDDVRRILDSVGAEVDEERLGLLFRQLEGKDVAELLAAGREMLAYVAGAGGTVAAIAIPSAVVAAAEEVKVEDKKKDEEDSDEELIVFCDLFG